MKEIVKFFTCSEVKRTLLEGKYIFSCLEFGSSCFEYVFNQEPDGRYRAAGKLGKHLRNC